MLERFTCISFFFKPLGDTDVAEETPCVFKCLYTTIDSIPLAL